VALGVTNHRRRHHLSIRLEGTGMLIVRTLNAFSLARDDVAPERCLETAASGARVVDLKKHINESHQEKRGRTLRAPNSLAAQTADFGRRPRLPFPYPSDYLESASETPTMSSSLPIHRLQKPNSTAMFCEVPLYWQSGSTYLSRPPDRHVPSPSFQSDAPSPLDVAEGVLSLYPRRSSSA